MLVGIVPNGGTIDSGKTSVLMPGNCVPPALVEEGISFFIFKELGGEVQASYSSLCMSFSILPFISL